MNSTDKFFAICILVVFGLPISLLFPAALVGVTVSICAVAMAKPEPPK